jgi:serine/threonine protein kinase
VPLVKNPTTATTQTMGPSAGAGARRLLSRGQRIRSPESGLEYAIDRLLGEGGFGQAYLAQRIGRSKSVAETLCIKISPHIDGWLREAYFGRLLDGHPRAIRVFDAFPLLDASGDARYCLALEYARHGDLAASSIARPRAGPRRRCGARSRGSSRCSGGCTAASCCTAI